MPNPEHNPKETTTMSLLHIHHLLSLLLRIMLFSFAGLILTSCGVNTHHPAPKLADGCMNCAEHNQYCADYAAKARAQNYSAQISKCQLKGLQWSSDTAGQQRWCKSVKRSISGAETVNRSNALLSCFGEKHLGMTQRDLETPSSQLKAKLLNTIKTDNVKRFVQLLAAGASLEGKFANQDKKDMTVATAGLVDIDSYLPNIVFANAIKITSFLLDHGANPNTKLTYDMTLASSAAIGKKPADYKMLDLLLSKGMNPNIRVSNNHPYPSLLSYASTYQNTPAVKIFLKHGANPVTEQILLGTNPATQPLEFAVTFGEVEMVKSLLAYNAPPNLLPKGADSCAHLRAKRFTYIPLDLAKDRLQKAINKYYPGKTNDAAFLNNTKDEHITKELRIIKILKDAGGISIKSCR